MKKTNNEKRNMKYCEKTATSCYSGSLTEPPKNKKRSRALGLGIYRVQMSFFKSNETID